MILQADSLSKQFYHPREVSVLRSITLSVGTGESVAIVGASGEGKTTLLHILGTLEGATSGTLRIAGETVDSSNASAIRNQEIGFIFQAFHLLEEATALENVLMPASIGRRRNCEEEAEELLKLVGLGDRTDFSVKLLSGGEKQRVAIARALMNNPKLLLADEPTGNLDRETSQSIHDLLLSQAQEKGRALIIVTHDPELAALCDRTLVLRDGVLEEAEEPALTV